MFDLLGKMIEAVLPITDDQLSKGYMEKRDRYVKLREAFSKFDVPMSGELATEQFKQAIQFVGTTKADTELIKQFNEVDIDGTGGLDFYEFVMADMGNKAKKVGVLGYVKSLTSSLELLLKGSEKAEALQPNQHLP